MRCRHRNRHSLVWRVGGGDVMSWFTCTSFETPDATICSDCGAWLSLGIATDTPETAIEVRAAELAQLAIEWETTRTIESAIALTCIGGPRSEAACLARAIMEHDDPNLDHLTEVVIATYDDCLSETADAVREMGRAKQ